MILLKSVFIIALVAVVMIGVMVPSVFAQEIYPLLVSVSPDGEPGNNQSYDHSISANGEFVVFVSNARNLVDDDQNFQTDVFVRDLLNEKTELVSISTNGKQGEYEMNNPTISGDGRYVVFNTRSSLDPDDINENSDVYMRDRESNKTIWISKSQTDSSSGYGDTGIISSDGKFIIFKSSSESLGLPNTNGNLFLWDNTRMTISSLGIDAGDFDISGNGKRIVFTGNNIPESTEGRSGDLFVYDRDSRKTTLISTPIGEFHSGRGSDLGAMDYEGNLVVFRSEAPNLVENDDNNDTSFFLHDVRTSKTKLISIDTNNESFFANSHPDISDDGKFVLMQQNGSLIYDVQTEKIIHASHYGNSNGSISSDGELITFDAPSSINNDGTPTPVYMDDNQIFVTAVKDISDSSTTVNPHSDENETVQTENPSSNAGLIIDKIIYHPGELITISGVVEDSQKGTQVKIILANPDGTNTGLTIYPNSDGEYSTIIQINSEYELGEYSILSSYNSKILGKESFSIQIKSQNNYDEPVVESTPVAPTPLGIASFVDTTKDPQSYVDRYNNEPTYKEWFDENYSQYSSIYEAIGLKEPDVVVEPTVVVEPIIEYIPEPTVTAEYVAEPVDELEITCGTGTIENKDGVCVAEYVDELEVTCGTGTESVNGICQVIQTEEKSSKGGGCLIATATYGSEMSQQVQQLRELRDNQLLQTESGTAFMSTFNDIYYSFSPIIADYERENPLFKEAVKLAITPMISSLSLMENANSESEVLGMGLSVIMLNIGMYLGVPAVLIVGIKRRF